MNMDHLGKVNLEKLKSLRRDVNLESREGRIRFLEESYTLLRDWQGQLPNVKDIFRPEEIERLVIESVDFQDGLMFLPEPHPFIDFLIGCGYKDDRVDDKPVLRRSTPIHRAARNQSPLNRGTIDKLFKIYDRFEANYIDDSGLTHFHVACMYSCADVVEKFLDAGQDPNCRLPGSGDSSLHLAVYEKNRRVTELLLKHGADPNLADTVDGFTPLHVIATKHDAYDYDNQHEILEIFFKLNDQLNNPVDIDAKDKLGRTALQCAVAELKPRVVDVLLDHGADLASFVLPPASSFSKEFKKIYAGPYPFYHKLRPACGVVDVLESLEKRGYEPDRRDALTIMKLFADWRLYEKSTTDLEIPWYDDETFARVTKNVSIPSATSSALYDLIRFRPAEAVRLLTSTDYILLVGPKLNEIPLVPSQACEMHLCEMVSRRFFRRWALGAVLELIRYRLPILCCEAIIEKLKNEDLFGILLAVGEKS